MATSAQAVELEEDYGSLTTEICDDTWRGGTAPPFHEPGWACFERSGDKFLVNVGDTVDGSPRVEWWNELKNARGDWKIYRQGYCYGEWYRHSTVVCNKNFYEDSTSPNALGGKGSRIVFLYRDSHGPSAKAVVLNDG
ncbi:hypothetical protein [Streptomyces echinatus]|uniref:Uncharacterized protein n=1 Tax=Streptomyces echinatus TaxID=67293 RepID=A0A7W9UV43_9ACTN|nr:hypothetical protein [Streptomyces echinatus]MBB5931861.1 hypothetical protein [Streptomyces echinatus]